jgi:catechol 2,3-dioxygenase-like lactoylglutathione lyase family enzyme
MTARLRHFAVVVGDLEKPAKFYEGVFGLKRVGQETLDFAAAIYLSDGVINLALLNYFGKRGSGLDDAKTCVGAHHFDLGNDAEKENFERKLKDPDGVIFDISKKGWQGTNLP